MDDNLLYKFYSDGIGQRKSHAQVAAYMDMLAHKTLDMNILEIGAGTGETTLPVLQAICCRGTRKLRATLLVIYFNRLFETARDKTKPWVSVMRFHKLDIEEEPADQGMEMEGYDVVIASAGLHATHSEDTTVANVRKLIKPYVPFSPAIPIFFTNKPTGVVN